MRNTPERARAAAALLGPLTLLGALGCASAPSPQTGPNSAAPGAEETAAGQTAGASSTASFTDGQADRGQTEFRQVCGDCHSTSEFRGENFQYTWRRRTAWDFYELVSTTMPEDAPGSLLDDQYVDVIAYILRLNGFTPGDRELPVTQEALDQFVMDAPGR
ncbi:MAG: hypothetical protein R3195_10765 [Gemmatimonadota bacterium]|nr:hypothetical protein [Gemmatimonadota bacterium]